MPTNVHLVKAMVFPVVMYGYESWTRRKAECPRIDAFELWCWGRLLGAFWGISWYNRFVHAQLLQFCLCLCDPMDCSPPGCSVHEILQARILEWVAIPFSRGFPDPGIKCGSPALQANSLLLSQWGSPGFILKDKMSCLRSGGVKGHYNICVHNLYVYMDLHKSYLKPQMKARLYDLELHIEIYQKEAKDASNITWIVHWLWKHPHFGSFLVVYIDLNPSKWLCVEKKNQCPN